MSRNYVFWRLPDGRRTGKEDDKHAPKALLATLGESASLPKGGGISWKWPTIHNHQLAVQSAIAVIGADGKELNDNDTASIAWEAIKQEVMKHGGGIAILPKEFLRRANEIAATHYRKPLCDYIMISSLSIEQLPAKSIQVLGRKISALKGRNRYPLPKALELPGYQESFGKHINETKYTTIRVQTAGRTVNEATDATFAAVNLLRGTWTLVATYGTWKMSMGSAKQEPIGVIHNGPIHTLHKPDGSIAADVFWFEREYVGDRKLFRPKLGWAALDKQRKWAMKRLRHLPYQEELKQLIIRFAEALDQPNLDLAFLQMWAILESVTGTIGARYEETVERATSVYIDRKVAEELLSHLRLRRNRLVHAAKSSEKREQVAYMVKSFVEPHLVNLLHNEFNVESIEDYGKFLALPTKLDALTKRRERLDLAIELRKKMDGAS